VPVQQAPTTPVSGPTSANGDAYQEVAQFFDGFAAVDARWRRRNRGYYELLTAIHRALIPPGCSVLEIGSGGGDLLAALEPSRGVGVDVSAGMTALARERHPGLEFEQVSGEEYAGDERFDYVVLSDLVPFAHDLLALFKNVARHSKPSTRIVMHSYSQLWRPVFRFAELLRMKPRKPIRNWVAPHDVDNLLALANLEPVTLTRRIMLPRRVPLLSTFLNGVVANVWPFKHLCATYWIVARPRPSLEPTEQSVSVICPARDEAGMIGRIVDELPEMGTSTELVFVEGHSTDGTRDEILRQIDDHPERRIRLVTQQGRGKGDAVRQGFAEAEGDILMILDADLTVRPNDLPRFYDALAAGHGEFVNGSRLVYGLEKGSMRFLNVLGNKLFSIVYSWLLDQPVKDTLCGTKALSKRHYEEIARGRKFFGDFDPFGDFDLLLGAAKLNLKIVDLPVRYGARTYGDTKISRFRHGWLLLVMSGFAFRKLKLEVLRVRDR
jgi:SAM-dependent methyltransferase